MTVAQGCVAAAAADVGSTAGYTGMVGGGVWWGGGDMVGGEARFGTR